MKVGASAKQLDVSEDNPLEVELIGLEMSPVWTPNGYIVRATAKGIKAVGKPNNNSISCGSRRTRISVFQPTMAVPKGEVLPFRHKCHKRGENN